MHQMKDIIFFDDAPTLWKVENEFAPVYSGYEFHLVEGTYEFSSSLFKDPGVKSFVAVERHGGKFRGFPSNNVIRVDENTNPSEVKKQIEWICSDFGRERTQSERTWFISDTHFNHGNIIRYCRKPWTSGISENGEPIVTEDDVREMNSDIVDNWNSVVKNDDVVWHLGDFAFGNKDEVPEFVAKLNGKINLVLGNHDRKRIGFYYDAGFHRVYDHPVVINGFAILSHVPLSYVRAPFYNIYGHVHNCSTYATWSKDGCCVCVERHNYMPVSLGQIEAKYRELNDERND